MAMKYTIPLLTLAAFLLFAEDLRAVDLPHGGPLLPQTCQTCHVVHNAPGTQITSVSGNANLCISCHTSGGSATRKPFTGSMNATPGVSGTSHRWDGAMPTISSPSNSFGLRPVSGLSTTILRNYLNKFGGITVCSVCHNPHSQASAAWDLFSVSLGNTGGGDSGTATAAGTSTTIDDSTKAALWIPDAWRNYYVRVQSSAAPANAGQVRVIAGNTATQLVVSTPFPASVQAGDRYEIVGRHYQRTADEMNQMCEDCHYYRVQNHLRVEGGDAAYPANGTNVFSHPVGAALHGNGKGYDRAAPLDANGAAQSGSRLGTGGEWPDNASNNLVLDGANAVRCLTCHNVHYSDSNSLTVDLP